MAANDPLHITFDGGQFGSIGNVFNVDASVSGEVTLRGDGAAMMEWASGPDAGHGYGTYTVVAKLDGNEPGPGIILWPADNVWPGQEIDMAEIAPDGSGRQYGTRHYDGGGWDSYDAIMYDGVAGGMFHEYKMVWEPGRITLSVDGQVMGAFTDHVPVDYAHGGINNTIGAININPNTSITVSDVRYDPLYDAPAAAAPWVEAVEDVAAAPAVAEVVDWNALAAQVQANYEATGTWYI